jgi:DNA mismatch repair ATPase MutS
LVPNSIVANESFLEAITKPLPESFEEDDNENHGRSSSGDNNDVSNNANDTPAVPPQRHRSIPYRLLRTGAFEHSKCLALILDKLRVLSVIQRSTNNGHGRLGEPRRIFPQQHHASGNLGFRVSNYNSVGSLIDLDSPLQVKCLGALLSFLESTIFKLEDGGTITVNDIVHAKSSMYMNINASTISALNIFATEHHPLVVSSGRGNSKEGSSLFSLLDRTRSRGGRQMLRNWMLKPLLDYDEIMLRQDGVELFCSQIDSDGHTGAILVLLQDVGPIHQILSRMKKCAPLPMDFVTTAHTLAAASEICRILEVGLLQRLHGIAQAPAAGNVAPNHIEEAQKARRYNTVVEKILYRCNVPMLNQLYERICSIVDEESTLEARDTIFIKTGFHEELDTWKEQYNSLDGKFVPL